MPTKSKKQQPAEPAPAGHAPGNPGANEKIRRLAAAKDLLRGSGRAIRGPRGGDEGDTAGEARRRIERNRAIFFAQAASLRSWAAATGLLLDAAQFEAAWQADGGKAGSEHDVWYDATTGRYFKRAATTVMQIIHAAYDGYFDRMLLHNLLFPEAPVTLEGLVEHGGALSPVISQPAVRGTAASENEIAAWMEASGYRQVGTDAFDRKLRGGTLRVEDAHQANVVRLANGELAAFDTIIFAPPALADALTAA